MNNFPFFNLNKKITALAPIDGFTDCAFREIVAKVSKPDIMFTEFVHSRAVIENPEVLIKTFRYTENQRPIIAQIFGTEPKYFYKTSIILCLLGFNGIDINMGCPARKVAGSGGGAGLIINPSLAGKIIKSVQKSVEDYKNNKIDDELINIAKQFIKKWQILERKDREITVSVKTRIGIDKNISNEWIPYLAKFKPDFITIHGRLLKQVYSGEADWDSIEKLAKKINIPIIGNGGIMNRESLVEKLENTNCAGVMVARGAIGNPWFFSNRKIQNFEEVKKVILNHAKLHLKFKGDERFIELRKHLVKYIKNIRGAKTLREKIVRVENLIELEKALASCKESDWQDGK